MQAARAALRNAKRSTLQTVPKRFMSGGHSDETTLKEMQKWRVVTYAAVPLCIGMAVYDLSGAEHHHEEEEKPQYPYMRIRSKEFPWGDCALFDGACWKQQALEAANSEE